MGNLASQRRKVGFAFGQRSLDLWTIGAVILEDAIDGSLAKTKKFNLNSRRAGEGSHAPRVSICARERNVRALRVRAQWVHSRQHGDIERERERKSKLIDLDSNKDASRKYGATHAAQCAEIGSVEGALRGVMTL